MRYSFTFQGECDADLAVIQRLLADFVAKSGVVGPGYFSELTPSPQRPDPMVQPDRTPAEEPKPRGRPRKPVADVGMSHPHGPVGSGEDQPAPANGPDAQLSDQGMLSTVGAFCSAHPDKTSAISALLRTFNAERITQLEAGQRQPFLTKLEALASNAPEAA